ncbi:MAG: DUF1343 domain-containing protein [Chlamydiales bacterium]|nr:DUF1343 domain-containing protein [Chlamydiales bacterium]
MKLKALLITFFSASCLLGFVRVGADVLVEENTYIDMIKNRRIGLISNQSAINHDYLTTLEILQKHHYNVEAVFAPEHGYFGNAHAGEKMHHQMIGEIPLLSMHGDTRRPTPEMLKDIDVLVYDIQDIGARSYTYVTTLFYCMEEAAKHHIPVIVLDRPNPMGGHVVDGPTLKDENRSYMSYVAVPYCHGMTVGELARFFNTEYKVGCDLTIVPMKGWKRGQTFEQTGLHWVPLSPQIPEADTPFFYATTGLIGHCSFLSIGIGYTLPFKIVGAPWVDAKHFAHVLNSQQLPGVNFQPFYFRPFFGKFKLKDCEGVRIVITDTDTYLPFTTQYTMIGIMKNLYSEHFKETMREIERTNEKKKVFHQLNGSEEVMQIFNEERFIIWKLRTIIQRDRERFLPIRQKYLLYS